jgi:hypothetical protein
MCCALEVCFFPLLPLWKITSMGTKKEGVKRSSCPTLDAIRSFFKPALLPFKEK